MYLDIKKDALLKDLALELTAELKNHMTFTGVDLGDYMDEALGIYRSDFPNKDARMTEVAQFTGLHYFFSNQKTIPI